MTGFREGERHPSQVEDRAQVNLLEGWKQESSLLRFLQGNDSRAAGGKQVCAGWITVWANAVKVQNSNNSASTQSPLTEHQLCRRHALAFTTSTVF